MQTPQRDDLDSVVASFNYLDAGEDKPKSYIGDPSENSEVIRPPDEAHEVSVHDSRAIVDMLSLDREGFTVEQHESAVTDFYNATEVKAVYYPEVEALVKQATGAARVVVFDHNVRNDTRAQAGQAGTRAPVRYVHNDYTEISGPQRVLDLLDPEEAEALLKHRFAVINVWRPIRGPVQDMPLAVLDATSMGPDDFVATDLVYADRTGEIYSVHHNSSHRWFYLSDMQRDEAMLLKCYDSATDGRARFTAHSAFANPASPADAHPRESIEARTLVFFPAEG